MLTAIKFLCSFVLALAFIKVLWVYGGGGRWREVERGKTVTISFKHVYK